MGRTWLRQCWRWLRPPLMERGTDEDSVHYDRTRPWLSVEDRLGSRTVDALPKKSRPSAEAEGLAVQTLRLATPPFPQYLAGCSPAAVLRFAQELEACCLANGLDYCALGPVDPSLPEEQKFVDLLPDLIAGTEGVFVSARLGNGDQVPTRPVTQTIRRYYEEDRRCNAGRIWQSPVCGRDTHSDPNSFFPGGLPHWNAGRLPCP